MGFYSRLKPLYRSVVPIGLRRVMSNRNLPFYRPLEAMKGLLARHSANDDVYDQDYFEGTIEQFGAASAATMAKSLVDALHPASVIDVGCGSGALLSEIARLGVKCKGFEYATAAIEIARKRGLDVDKLDLRDPPTVDNHADLAISMEVAEHLPPDCADGFVDFLAKMAPKVVLTAATPGQGGTGHVNEQPNEYWIEKFRQRGFELDGPLTTRFRDDWRAANVADFYYRNVMVLRKAR
jgi:SAM-dependent methyltransferase